MTAATSQSSTSNGIQYRSASRVDPTARAGIIDALNRTLSDSLDLHTQIKLAHWNVRGPHFAALHPLFEQFAVDLAGFGDAIAERAVTLGGRAVASRSALPAYPGDISDGIAHAAALLERFEQYLDGTRVARGAAEQGGDTDTVDLLTAVVSAFEKHAWFLRATVDR
jgi:starvation-inducible DNA-binding protein